MPLTAEISATLRTQKFLTPQNFSNYFSEIDFSRFRRSIFPWTRCALSEIFFWGDTHRLRVKPHGIPKSRIGPPRGITCPFSSSRWQRSHFSAFFEQKPHFARKIKFLPSGWWKWVCNSAGFYSKLSRGRSPQKISDKAHLVHGKIERRNLKKSISEKELEKFWGVRKFCVLSVAEISAVRGPTPRS